MKSQFVVKIVKYHKVFMKPLSEVHLLFCIIYITNANMAVTSAQFLSLFKHKGKSIKRGKKQYKHGHVKSCSHAKRKLVESVRHDYHEVTYATIRCVVFLNM